MKSYIYVNTNVMRLSFIIIVCAVLVTSCSPILKLGKSPKSEKPYVLLIDSTIIHSQTVEEEMGYYRGRIMADTTAYERSDVMFYSDGKQTFGNLGMNKFGPKIASGKINVYSETNLAQYGYPEHDLIGHLYIQDSGSSKIYLLSYHPLKKMIPASCPAGIVLQNYKHTRLTLHLIMLGGLASFIGGSIIAGNGVVKDQNAKTSTGLTMIFGGMGVVLGGAIPLYPNRMKLKRSIAIYNGVLDHEP